MSRIAFSSPEDKHLINTAQRFLNDLEEFIPYLEKEQVLGFVFYEGENYLANVVAIAEYGNMVVSDANCLRNLKV